MDNKQAIEHFTKIYHSNYWHGIDSRSGTGSDLVTTSVLRPHLVALINTLGIKSMIDAPCGDFFWMKEIIDQFEIDEYLGIDIVKEMIDAVKVEYESVTKKPKRVFKVLNVIEDILPKTDVIFSRDCLVHFSYETARKILKNFVASGSEYVLMTTFLSDERAYPDILDGQWRAINFQLKPFNLPEPERLVIEGCIEDSNRWTDKSLGLWKLADLKGIL
jgi:SAM-dependent methyltransferase